MKLIQSYVWHKQKKFFVSTINRTSSSTDGGRYAETMAWAIIDDAANEREFIGQSECCFDGISAHLKACADIFNTGKMGEDK